MSNFESQFDVGPQELKRLFARLKVLYSDSKVFLREKWIYATQIDKDEAAKH